MDGWTGSELSALPEDVWGIFADVVMEWLRFRQVPAMMRNIRQVSLPKPGKSREVKNLRPISVLSVWWRAFEGGQLRTPSFTGWRQSFGGHNVAYRESAEEMAAMAGIAYEQGGVLAALDFSKAYDKMDPNISGDAMRATKVPESIIGTLLRVWKHQERWVSFDQHFSKRI